MERKLSILVNNDNSFLCIPFARAQEFKYVNLSEFLGVYWDCVGHIPTRMADPLGVRTGYFDITQADRHFPDQDMWSPLRHMRFLE